MTFTRFLTWTRTPVVRRGVLGLAGLLMAGGTVAAPVSAAYAAPAPAAVTQQAQRPAQDQGGHKELDVRYQAQPNFYYCGPAAVRNALTASGHDLDMDQLARQMGTTERGTDSAHEITRALNEAVHGDTYHTVEIPQSQADQRQTDTLAADIRKAVDEGRAVVVNIAGTATDVDGGVHSFEGGHYLAVNGYRDGGRQVKIADSADPDTAAYWMDVDVLADWIATRGYSA